VSAETASVLIVGGHSVFSIYCRAWRLPLQCSSDVSLFV